MPKKDTGREVVYPELKAVLYTGEGAVTVEQMKRWLGWEVIPPGAGKDKAALFTDHEGNDIRFANNAHNRHFQKDWADELAHTLLMRHWADSRNGDERTCNGEAFIIGRYGNVLSGQHRGAGLVLAEQLRKGPEEALWRKNWPHLVTMEMIVVFGVDESAETIGTLDNTRPRTFADVLYSEGEVFARDKADDRDKLCKIMERAVREIWSRTGLKYDALASYGTNLEMLEFVQRHPYLKDCVKHVWDEDKYGKDEEKPKGSRGKVGDYVGLGTAAGLMYLMAQSATDDERAGKWRSLGVTANQNRLDMSRKKQAEDFWVLLAGRAPDFEAVRRAKVKRGGGSVAAFGSGEDSGTVNERAGILVRAFKAFVGGGEINARAVSLSYKEKDGEVSLREFPSLGGVDLGKPGKPKKEDDGGGEGLDEDDAEEIERRKQQVKKEGLAATRDDAEPSGNGHAKPKSRSRGKKKAEEEAVAVGAGEDNDPPEGYRPDEDEE